jgi:hypothetical protein
LLDAHEPQDEEREERRELDREERERLDGTFPPARRASERPMAMACLRLFTFLPERPDFSSPRFISCIARSTFSEAFFPYFVAMIPPRRFFTRARRVPSRSTSHA